MNIWDCISQARKARRSCTCKESRFVAAAAGKDGTVGVPRLPRRGCQCVCHDYNSLKYTNYVTQLVDLMKEHSYLKYYELSIPSMLKKQTGSDQMRLGSVVGFQPDLTAIRTNFTRWLIHTNSQDLTRILLNRTYFSNCPIRMNPNNLHLTPPLNLTITRVSTNRTNSHE